MKYQEDIVVISAARTPFGRFGGSLRQMDIYDLGANAMRAALNRKNIPAKLIDEVWWGVW